MNDEYDFCALKRDCCPYQVNGDKKIKTLEKALYMACSGREYLIKDFMRKAEEE